MQLAGAHLWRSERGSGCDRCQHRFCESSADQAELCNAWSKTVNAGYVCISSADCVVAAACFFTDTHRVVRPAPHDIKKSWSHVTLGCARVPAGCLCLTAAQASNMPVTTQTLLRGNSSI
jgi:hypothetical protein